MVVINDYTVEAGADLSGADLSGQVLSGADLTGANLTGTNFTGADLQGVDFTNADLTGANFTGANLASQPEKKTVLNGSTVARVNFTNADLTGAELSNLDFYSSILTGINQVGDNIDGEAAGDNSGYSVSLNNNGNIVAIGAPYNDEASGDEHANKGHVRVYGYKKPTSDEWNNGNVIKGGDATQEPNKFYWTQHGSDIPGEAKNDNFGYAVSLSSDGNTLAAGAIYNDDRGNGSGHVRVYKYKIPSNDEWNNGNVIKGGDASQELNKYYWTQLGYDIDGEVSSDYSGCSPSLSNDGTIVAIGAIYNDGGGSASGHVRVYKYKIPTNDEWNNGNVIKGSDATQEPNKYYWTQLGEDIAGEASSDNAYRCNLSSDGTIVAIGATGNDGIANNAGHVRVYHYKIPTNDEWNNGNVIKGGVADQELNKYYWVQHGNDIDGETSNNQSGWSVSLSNDGTIVAIGAITNSDGAYQAGHCRVYHYKIPTNDEWVNGNVIKGTDGAQLSDKYYWTQLGGDIDGENYQDSFGFSVSLSGDGTIVAIGARNNDDGGNNSGHVKVYQYENNSWSQMLETFVGGYGDQAGWSVSLSRDGAFLAYGAPFDDSGRGRVRIFIIKSKPIFKGADFTDTTFTNLDLRTSELENVTLKGANLTNVNLTDADLTGVSSGSMQIDADTDLPSGYNIQNNYIVGPKLSFKDEDLTGFDFTGANFTNVDFTGANLTRTTLTGTNLTGAILDNVTWTDFTSDVSGGSGGSGDGGVTPPFAIDGSYDVSDVLALINTIVGN